MKYLILETGDDSLRSTIVGWNCEDTTRIELGKHIGLSSSPGGWWDTDMGLPPSEISVLHALAQGWRLLAPPQKVEFTTGRRAWEWWLVKD